MAIAEIKKDIEALLQLADTAKALRYLQDHLPESSDKRTQAVLLESRLAQANKAHQNGQIPFGEQQMVVANVNAAILDLSGGLTEMDLQPGEAGVHAAKVSAIPKFVVIYAPEDEAHAKMLNRHLNLLKITKKIRVYNVQEALGMELLAQAKLEIQDSDYLLVLITVNLFNSEQWFGLVYESLGEGRRMIPLRIEQADFDGTGLERIKSLPSMGRAVSDFANTDAAYTDIVGELKKLLPK